MVKIINFEFEAPIPTKLSKNSVFRVAEAVAENLGYKPGNDLHELVEELGGRVKTKNFWAEGSNEGGSLEVLEQDNFTIFIPNDTSEVRDRFTIAHELGHYFLHYLWQLQVQDKPDFKLRASRYGSDRAEWEANWFASAFLMPSSEFKKVKEQSTLNQVSRHFRVSLQAAEIRSKALGLDDAS